MTEYEEASAESSVDDFLRRRKLPSLIRRNSPVPAHLIYRVLLESGLEEESLRFHASLEPDVYFSEIVGSKIGTHQGSAEALHLYVRRRGISTHLPEYMRSWLRARDGAPKSPFRDFADIIDDEFIRLRYRLQTRHLSHRWESDGLSLADRVVVGLLGLKMDDWQDDAGQWCDADLRNWSVLLPGIVAGMGGRQLLVRALESFFPFLRREITIKLEENAASAETIPKALQARLSEASCCGASTYLGDHWDVRFRRLRIHLGPLGLHDYWSLVRDDGTTAEGEYGHSLGRPGKKRHRLEAILAHVLPVELEPEIVLSLAPSEIASAVATPDDALPAILGHNAVISPPSFHAGGQL